jgi:hypothetical protein
MKKNMIDGGIALAFLLAPQILQAQGTMYLSNLSDAPVGVLPIGSDSWLGLPFIVGRNPTGYTLNSFQFSMADASGVPDDLSVTLFQGRLNSGVLSGTTIGSLEGSLSPVSGGIYSYTPSSTITLTPGNLYAVILTAGTSISAGAFNMNNADAIDAESTGWVGSDFAGVTIWTSSNGSLWGGNASDAPQYAVYATAVPEPSAWAVFLFGGGVLMYACFGKQLLEKHHR